MPTGTVKWYHAIRGYGFIIPTEGGDDLLVRSDALESAGLKTLKDQQGVSYEVGADGNGDDIAVALAVI